MILFMVYCNHTRNVKTFKHEMKSYNVTYFLVFIKFIFYSGRGFILKDSPEREDISPVTSRLKGELVVRNALCTVSIIANLFKMVPLVLHRMR